MKARTRQKNIFVSNDIFDQIRIDLDREALGDDVYTAYGVMQRMEKDEATDADMAFIQGFLAS